MAPARVCCFNPPGALLPRPDHAHSAFALCACLNHISMPANQQGRSQPAAQPERGPHLGAGPQHCPARGPGAPGAALPGAADIRPGVNCGGMFVASAEAPALPLGVRLLGVQRAAAKALNTHRAPPHPTNCLAVSAVLRPPDCRRAVPDRGSTPAARHHHGRRVSDQRWILLGGRKGVTGALQLLPGRRLAAASTSLKPSHCPHKLPAAGLSCV